MQINHYTEPRIYGKTLKQEWFVGFKFDCAQRLLSKRVQVRLSINYRSTVKGREQEAEAVRVLTKKALDDGWNPFDEDIRMFLRRNTEQERRSRQEEDTRRKSDPASFAFNEALDWAASKKTTKKNTTSGVKTTRQYAKQAASDLGFASVPVKDITRFHVCEILDRMLVIRQAAYDTSTNRRYEGKKVTPNLYNGYLDRLSGLFFEYENRGLIEFNPCSKIRKKEDIDFGVHRHATGAEIAIIKAELPKRHDGLYQFIRFEHVSGMRPDEILNTRFDMLNYRDSCIDLSVRPYDETGEIISKTTVFRRVPIPAFLLEWLRERSVGHAPSDYIFSRRFLPGPRRITVTWVSTLWKKIVRDELGIHVSVYSFKGLGGDAKREAGIGLTAVAAGYGHTSTKLARRVYLEKEGERLRKEIIEKAPDL